MATSLNPDATTGISDPSVKRETNLRQVSRSVPRLESTAKVNGTAEYINHLRLSGMLYGKIHRSAAAHARIVRIDKTVALAVVGVHAVITAEDICKVVPEPYYGPAFLDQPVLAHKKVRHVGEAVAVVLAADPDVAEEAANLIAVEYETLDPVFDEVEAAQPGAPILHESIKPSGTFPDLKNLKVRGETNIALDAPVRHGDIEQGFAQSDHIFEHTFRTRKAMHTPFEPIATIGELKGNNLVLHTTSQSPSFVRTEVSRMLGWPENRVRVRTAFLGGAFGSKLYIKLEALVACLVLIARRPVKVALTMEEQFYTITKHGTTVRMKTGVTKEGRMLARRAEVWWNGGAYADIGPRVTQKSGFTAVGPYDIENVELEGHAVYTNEPPAGALRGFGIPQMVWAYECQADIIAHELGIDPLEFRRRNLLRDGRPHATGTIITNSKLEEILDCLQEKMQWDQPFDHGSGPIRRGRGIAIGMKACVAPTTSVAQITVYGDGSCALACGTVDMGQGSDTALAQIVGEVFGIDPAEVHVIHPDTDVTPYDMATLGSRSTFHSGNAVCLAAKHARAQLLEIASKSLGVGVEELELYDGAAVTRSGSKMTLAEIMESRFKMQAGNVIGIGTFTPSYVKPDPQTGQSPNITPFWMNGGVGVELEVDTETGRIRILKMVNVGDVGRAINPGIVARQLNGAAVMQLGGTICEEMLFDGGQVLNASLADYKVPSINDVPQHWEAVLVEEPNPDGPFGAKGAGETGTFAVSPAIANALYDAVGVRMFEVPFTPEKVLRAIREAQNRPLEKE